MPQSLTTQPQSSFAIAGVDDTPESIIHWIKACLPPRLVLEQVKTVVVLYGPDCRLLLHLNALDYAAQDDSREWYSAAAANVYVPAGPGKATVVRAVRRLWPDAQLLDMGVPSLREANTCALCGVGNRRHQELCPGPRTIADLNPSHGRHPGTDRRVAAYTQFIEGFFSGYFNRDVPIHATSVWSFGFERGVLARQTGQLPF